MFPAGFDQDDQLFANTRFGDYPHWLPAKKWTNKDELFTGWMLLSYKKAAEASSVLDTFNVAKVTDENPRTFWVARENKPGEWVTVDLGSVQEVNAVQINYTDYQSDIFDNDPARVYTQFRILCSTDGKQWKTVRDLTHERKRDRPNAYIELPNPVRARFVKYEHIYVASPNLAISDIRVFGRGAGKTPNTPASFVVRRDVDERNAFAFWQPVKGAVGYNILWGIAPDKLYLTYQVFGDRPSSLEVRALTKGVHYFFAIEAYNENGVSKSSEVIGIN
jgi:hypothetical protein